jgi:hypothetical protein
MSDCLFDRDSIRLQFNRWQTSILLGEITDLGALRQHTMYKDGAGNYYTLIAFDKSWESLRLTLVNMGLAARITPDRLTAISCMIFAERSILEWKHRPTDHYVHVRGVCSLCEREQMVESGDQVLCAHCGEVEYDANDDVDSEV